MLGDIIHDKPDQSSHSVIGLELPVEVRHVNCLSRDHTARRVPQTGAKYQNLGRLGRFYHLLELALDLLDGLGIAAVRLQVAKVLEARVYIECKKPELHGVCGP